MNIHRISAVGLIAAVSAATIIVGTPVLSPLFSTSPLKGEVYVQIVNDGDWNLTSPQRGFYLVNPSDGSVTEKVINNDFTQGQASVIVNGLLYISNIQASGTAWAYNGDMSVYDIVSGELVKKITYPAQNWENRCTAFAYNKASDEVWACVNGDKGATNGKEFYLARFNPGTCEYTTVKKLSTGYAAMASDPNNNIYGVVGGSADIVRIADDGSYSIIASAPETPRAGTPVALTYSPDDECLIYIYQNNAEETKMASITTEQYNERYSEICVFGNRPLISLAYATGSWAAHDAPADISDLSVTYATPGSCMANVSFSVPVKSVDGSNLTGSYTAMLTIDSQTTITLCENLTAGDAVTETVELQEGLHVIKVRLLGNGNASDGTAAVTSTFAGFDFPTSVKNLTYAKTADGKLTLNWEAPVGQHNAPLGGITYHISVNGEGDFTTTDTQWTDQNISADMAAYTYSIYAEAAGKSGPAVSSGKIVLGNPLEVPYESDFSTESSLNLYTVINANGDINGADGKDITWQYVSYAKAVQYHRPGLGMDPDGGDDYLVLPALSLKAGVVYVLRFNVKVGSNNPETMEVLASKGAFIQDIAQAEIIAQPKEFTNRNYAVEEVSFVPEADGAYNFAIHYITPLSQSIDVTINHIEVASIGSALAPSTPEDLSVIPEGNGSLRAVVQFKAPSTDYSGNSIDTLSSVTIYRDGEEIHTIADCRPGQLMAYTDEVPATDFYTYSVAAANEHGYGRAASSRACVGALSLPLELDLTTEEGCRDILVEDLTPNDRQTFHFDQEMGGLAYIPSEYGYVYTQDYFHTRYVFLRKGEIVSLSTVYSICNEDASQDMNMSFKVTTESGVQPIYPWLVVRRGEKNAVSSASFSVPSDGLYCFGIGFDNNVNATHTGVVVHSFDVVSDVNPDAPAAVNFRQAKSADDGSLSAVVEFNMPTVSAGGNTLDSDTQITATIFNSLNEQVGQVIGTPGELCTADFTTIQGTHYYTISTSSEAGQGMSSSFGLFSGIDAPMRVTNMQVLANDNDNMSAEISWDAPVDSEHGGWFNTDELAYIINVYDNNGDLLKSFNTDKRYVVYATEETDLARYEFDVTPYTNAGYGSQPLRGYAYLGTPLTMPFNEDFANGEYSTGPWQFESWYPGVHDTYGAGLIFGSGRGGAILPKLTLKGSVNPTISFDIYHYANSFGTLNVQISGDDINWASVTNGYVHTGSPADGVTGTYGWANDVKVDLSGYKSYNWVSIKLFGEGTQFAVRNLRVYDLESATECVIYDAASADEYFTLQGVRVVEPVKGNIYIRRSGDAVEKIIFQ